MLEDKLRDFIRGWESVIDDVKNEPSGIDDNGAKEVRLRFQLEKNELLLGETVFLKRCDDLWRRVDGLERDLIVALALARARYEVKMTSGIVSFILLAIMLLIVVLLKLYF
ncbi:MAG: hypothetical protein OD814_001526 [Candidatus Alkanophagales archaeon MCA70_species_1]|nr:hypothetical protein [Candidatus Alkanophaga volatiphilum]